MGNTFKTAFLLTALTLLLMALGRAFGGQNGMLLALGIAAVMNFVSYFFSDKIALAMYRAQPVTREQLPRAYNIVERLTQKIGLPMPKLFVIPTDSPNALPSCGWVQLVLSSGTTVTCPSPHHIVESGQWFPKLPPPCRNARSSWKTPSAR